MLKSSFKACLLAGSLSLATLPATAQEMVHALAGTVSAINPTAKTITVKTDDGSEGKFKDWSNSQASIDFDKKLRAEVTPADAFKDNGSHVIVFYYGMGDVRTAVALRNLGTGPIEKSSGSLLKFDRGKHLFTIKNSSGADETFYVNDKTVAESPSGAVEGEKFDPNQGDQLRVTASAANGKEMALFIVPVQAP